MEKHEFDVWLCVEEDGSVVNVEVMEAGARGYASGAKPPVEVRKARAVVTLSSAGPVGSQS